MLAEAYKELGYDPHNGDLILKHQEVMDRISRLLLHESAIELSEYNKAWIIDAGNEIYAEIEYTIKHLLPAQYQKNIFE